jgi:DNA-binding response OmpR family regulator
VGSTGVRARGVPPPAGAVAMARVLALVPDLLFGSRVQAALTAAGYDVELIADARAARDRLDDDEAAAAGAAVLVVDLTNEDLDGAALVESLAAAGLLSGTRTLGFYAHVDAPVRARAVQAGFDLVVPRSRMAREGAELVARLT